MCGICGIINFNKEPVEEVLIRKMMQKIKHRGPDDEGLFIDQNYGFGFVRLSILDLSPLGHQPMFDQNNRFMIIHNGEIYNYIEIREELKKKSYTFRSNTDTELILYSYIEWGEDCLNKFNGMWAFVIFDKIKREVFASRDRFGVKPFYYFKDNNRLIFASEIKSILPLVNRDANNKIIYDYLLFNRTDHTEETFFKGIKKLQHGHYFKIKEGKIVFIKWYNLSVKINNKYLSPEDYRKLFNDSLKLRLRADVPIGVSLSGGIDSSSIVTSLIKDFGLIDLNTFSAIYGKDEPTDESDFIDEFKKSVKNMHFTNPSAESFFNDFEDFIDAHNEPVPDIGPYAQYKVMELASKYVTVTLDGQGADEQLAGYHNFFSIYYLELLRKLKVLTFIKENIQYLKKHKKLIVYNYLAYYILPIGFQNRINSGLFPSVSIEFIEENKLTSNISKNLYKPKSLNESLFQHLEYKLEHLLRWEDLNAMHFSIESRVPFLDYRLVEATLSTPSSQKIYQGETKYLLREALKDILPIKITNRKDKKGFSNPRDKWFRSARFQKYIFELINSESFKNRGYFDSTIVDKLYHNHLDGKIDRSKEIWKWINLEVWFRKFIH